MSLPNLESLAPKAGLWDYKSRGLPRRYHPPFLLASFGSLKRTTTIVDLIAGIVVNSKDRTRSRTANNATFNMTNILPQAPHNNQGPWVKLENFERSLAQAGNEVYIIAGAFGSGGTGEILALFGFMWSTE